jgi:hypothetical protein
MSLAASALSLFFLSLFTGVRGIGILRSSPFGDSPKFVKKVSKDTAIE